MVLPGGLCDERGRHREVTFRGITGELEMAAASDAASYPVLVTSVLTAAIDAIGGRRTTAEEVRALSVGDRRVLLWEVGVRLGRTSSWTTSACRECSEPFDARVDLTELPVKPAGADYPVARARTSAGLLAVRVPTGADQEAIATLEPAVARWELLRLCILDASPSVVEALGEDDVGAIEAAIDAAAPQPAESFVTYCPACGTANELELDVDAWLRDAARSTLGDVHELATAYGWSERDILSLPRARRAAYLRLIEDASG